MEGRVAHKRGTQATEATAQQRVVEAEDALQAAQKALEKANSEYEARTKELQSLERELAELQHELPISTLESLNIPPELAGDEEVAQAIAKAEKAGQEATAVLASKLPAQAPLAAVDLLAMWVSL